MHLSCSQIGSLLTFYINGKLNYPISEMVQEHLEECSSCQEKYQALLNIKLKFVKAKEYLDSINFAEELAEDCPKSFEQEEDYALVQNLSAYSDNELSDDESLKLKKYVITNLSARRALEEIYDLRTMLKSSFNKSEIQLKEDYAKSVLTKLNIDEEIRRGGSRLKVASVLIFVLTSFTVGLIYLITNMLV
ncbi:zf-HC2 domain-containing protein [bacterium]|nr:zf-HC2 domain-containing protein [bacterium]